jgi:branched-chain amino acid transport system ATP-binding protein
MQHKTLMLSYKNVQAKYGAIQALRGVSVDIYQNEIVTLIGANGAGKSTLMMSTFSQPKIYNGKIEFMGESINNIPTHDIAQLGIAISPEGRRIFPKMTVEENLYMGALRSHNIENSKTIKEVYDLFPILFKRKQQRAGTLSGGEQQMLAMGRALMGKPKCFLLDEPSLGLAPQMVKLIFSILRDIAQRGTTIFLVEQNANHALNIADRGYVMVNGEITLSGKACDLLENSLVQEAYLGGKH